MGLPNLYASKPGLHAAFFRGGYLFYKTFLNLICCELAARIDRNSFRWLS
jgi:hypothetical protein